VDALLAPYWAAALLLLLAGLPKIRDPLPLVRALRSVRLPASRLAVRALAAAEVVTGTAALTTGSRLTAALVATSYAAFTAFVVLALRRGGVLASCGCFGTPDTPPTRAHAALTATAAVAAAAVALDPVGGVAAALSTQPGGGVPLLAVTAAVAATAYAVLAVLPRLVVRRPA
jgi:hypothetical protein